MSGSSAVVLVSGGLDSATALAMVRAEGVDCIAMSFDYGQRHRYELKCAEAVCHALGVQSHHTITLDPVLMSGSALTGGGEVPPAGGGEEIPDTYVPARNTIFLAMALGVAERVGADRIVIGANALDYSGYPDCRPEFIKAFQEVIDVGTRAGIEGLGIKVEAPLLHLRKSEIIQAGHRLGLDYGMTSSCYDVGDDGTPCGVCDSCHIRRDGFAAAGLVDPREVAP